MINVTNDQSYQKAKDALDRDLEPTRGDFVTVYDNSKIVEVYVLKELNYPNAILYKLCLTNELDDVYVAEVCVPMDDLVYVDESFVNVNGYLWDIRNKVLESREDSIKTIVYN